MCEKVKKSMASLCRTCQGRCCQPPIFLGQYDVDKLRRKGFDFDIEPVPQGAGYDLISEGNCPFLKKGIGCTLEEEDKPIDCLIFPLTFSEENLGQFKFYPSKHCLFFKQIPDSWIQQTTREGEKKILKWSVEERKTYIKRQ